MWSHLLCDMCKMRIPEVAAEVDIVVNEHLARVEADFCCVCMGDPSNGVIRVHRCTEIKVPGGAERQ